jgi:hypothetical protein
VYSPQDSAAHGERAMTLDEAVTLALEGLAVVAESG